MTVIEEDTIAAISTPMGAAGLGIVRMSGPESLQIAQKVFQAKNNINLIEADNYTIHYGHVIEPETEKIIDEVIVVLMKNPHSFTGEDVVEFDCHGGMVPLRKVLEVLLANGARMAEPGEFSRRAFLNGRLDLAQAESIVDIINARTEKSLDLAVNQLRGKLSRKIKEIKDQAIELLAHLEAAIDFPDDEIAGFKPEELDRRLEQIKKEIEQLLATGEQGKIYREGLKTVIVGKPNVGKSSLLNTLLEEKRAIVTDVPGTTRDAIEEFINLEGIPLQIVDTAGIRETEDMVEKIGVDKAREFLEQADLVLMMLDVSQGITEDDLKVYDLIRDKPLIVIINKMDLPPEMKEKEVKQYFSEHPLVWLSIKEEEGLENLTTALKEEIFSENVGGEEAILITRARHKKALQEALEAIERVIDTRERQLPYDFLTIDLKDCLNNLGEITGETAAEDIVDRIFADFCLGK